MLLTCALNSWTLLDASSSALLSTTNKTFCVLSLRWSSNSFVYGRPTQLLYFKSQISRWKLFFWVSVCFTTTASTYICHVWCKDCFFYSNSMDFQRLNRISNELLLRSLAIAITNYSSNNNYSNKHSNITSNGTTKPPKQGYQNQNGS